MNLLFKSLQKKFSLYNEGFKISPPSSDLLEREVPPRVVTETCYFPQWDKQASNLTNEFLSHPKKVNECISPHDKQILVMLSSLSPLS